MELISKYFKNLTTEQTQQFLMLQPLYADWNEKINVISRKDMENFYLHHVLHSLAIARFIRFTEGTQIIDVGTGGGFPGIPLAIMFPNVNFMLIDSIGKKITVVQDVAEQLGLKNVRAQKTRVEDIKEKFDFVVSRAVTALPAFEKMSRHVISLQHRNAINNGILYLKGGDFTDELKSFGKRVDITELPAYFEESFFETKKLIHLSIQ